MFNEYKFKVVGFGVDDNVNNYVNNILSLQEIIIF